jgi:hypothetical protein
MKQLCLLVQDVQEYIHTTGVFSLFFVEFCDVPTLVTDHPQGELAKCE